MFEAVFFRIKAGVSLGRVNKVYNICACSIAVYSFCGTVIILYPGFA